MKRDRLRAVRAQFGDPLPAGLDTLTDDELADLAAVLAEARRDEEIALDGAIGHTPRVLPWPLSGIVRRILIG